MDIIFSSEKQILMMRSNYFSSQELHRLLFAAEQTRRLQMHSQSVYVSFAMLQTQAPLAISLGTFWFEVGPNCYSCSLTPSFDAVLDVKVQGETQQLHIPYAWHSSGPSDFLTFSQAAPLMFDFGNQGMLVIALDAIATLVSSGGKVYGDLYATASMAPASITPVPEPASFALMLAGFGVIAFVARRRQGFIVA